MNAMSRTFAPVAAGALAAALAIGAGPPSAQAAPPAPNPLAGSYRGGVPGTSCIWQVTVTDRGAVSGTGWGMLYNAYASGKLTGTLSADGKVSVKGTESIYHPPGPDCSGSCTGYTETSRFAVRATGTADSAGTLTFTTSRGDVFVWTRL